MKGIRHEDSNPSNVCIAHEKPKGINQKITDEQHRQKENKGDINYVELIIHKRVRYDSPVAS